MRTTEEEDRTPVGRSDFKSGEMRTTCLVGSTPTLFRQPRDVRPRPWDVWGRQLVPEADEDDGTPVVCTLHCRNGHTT